MAVPCVVFEFVWNMRLVKSDRSHGIVEGWVVVVAVVVVVVDVALHLVGPLTQMTAALLAMNVVIIHMTVLALVGLVIMTAARGT